MWILQTISHTPMWVIILFFTLLYLGFNQTKDRKITIQRVFILPFIMLLLSITGILFAFGISISNISLWFISMIFFTILGKRLITLKNISYDHNTKYFLIKGSWTPMVLILSIFFIKYSVGYMVATDSKIVYEENFAYMISVAYGIINGIFLARAFSI